MLRGIEIRASGTFDLLPEGDKRQRLERIRIERGAVIEGEVRCYVTADLVEVADILLELLQFFRRLALHLAEKGETPTGSVRARY